MIATKWGGITKKITRKQVRHALLTNKTIYTISPSLFSRPNNWKENIKVLGYHERNKVVNWKPGEALENFMQKKRRT
jgi:hypothetical protein